MIGREERQRGAQRTGGIAARCEGEHMGEDKGDTWGLLEIGDEVGRRKGRGTLPIA